MPEVPTFNDHIPVLPGTTLDPCTRSVPIFEPSDTCFINDRIWNTSDRWARR
jgi:hypothetical protein